MDKLLPWTPVFMIYW